MAKSGKKRAKAEKAKTHLKTSLKAAKKPKKKKDGIRSHFYHSYQLTTINTDEVIITYMTQIAKDILLFSRKTTYEVMIFYNSESDWPRD